MTRLHRFTLLATLYFAQGLPYGFFQQALPALLRKSDWSLSAIGLTSLFATPWAARSGTDYTVQASAVVIAQGAAATLSGFSADAIGYGPHFVAGAALCAVAVLLAVKLFPARFP